MPVGRVSPAPTTVATRRASERTRCQSTLDLRRDAVATQQHTAVRRSSSALMWCLVGPSYSASRYGICARTNCRTVLVEIIDSGEIMSGRETTRRSFHLTEKEARDIENSTSDRVRRCDRGFDPADDFHQFSITPPPVAIRDFYHHYHLFGGPLRRLSLRRRNQADETHQHSGSGQRLVLTTVKHRKGLFGALVGPVPTHA